MWECRIVKPQVSPFTVRMCKHKLEFLGKTVQPMNGWFFLSVTDGTWRETNKWREFSWEKIPLNCWKWSRVFVFIGFSIQFSFFSFSIPFLFNSLSFYSHLLSYFIPLISFLFVSILFVLTLFHSIPLTLLNILFLIHMYHSIPSVPLCNSTL